METGNGAGSSRRIALLIQYDGTAFNGWQIQEGGRTVQQEIERAVEILTREKPRLTASGRTDAGVHALGQVAHLDLKNTISLQRLCNGLNGILNRDVSILNAYSVNPDFHARFDAVSREYVYLIYNYNQRSPFMAHRAMWIQQPMEIEYLREAAQYLIGTTDFASFCKKISLEENTVRRIESIRIDKKENVVRIRITGNAFLHNMVRIIVGTLCEMVKNNSDPSYMRTIIEKRDRNFSGATAPPHGLYLRNVAYQPPLTSMESAF